MNRFAFHTVAWLAGMCCGLGGVMCCGAMHVDGAEVLYSENFDEPGVKPGQSILEAPIGWTLVAPNDAAKNLVGNVLLGSGKFGWTGNYMDGSTAAAAEAENVVFKAFSPVAQGQIVLACKAFAPGKTAAASQISLRPAQSRYSNRAIGWACTPEGWEFFVGLVTSSHWPLGEVKPGPYRLLKEPLVGGHDVSIVLKTYVDLDHNKAWGEAEWTDADGKPQHFKSAVFDCDSAPGNIGMVLVSMDKRNGQTGIALDDLQVDGEPTVSKPHPFEQPKHVVQQLNGDKEPRSCPAEIQWISKPWNEDNAQLPYLAYLPAKDQLVMLVSSKKPEMAAMIFSDDHGKTWSDRQWLSVDASGNPNAHALGLTALGQGKLIAFAETLAQPFWYSSDDGKTWQQRASASPPEELYSWDPLLAVPGTDGRVAKIVQACWKPTGIPWGSAEAPYSQAYLRSTIDEGEHWSPARKIPQWLGIDEINLLIAKNGDWVAACRTDSPKRFAENAFDHFGGLGVSISKDQGETWSEVKLLHEWGRHHPSMVLLPDGRILMSYVVRLGYPDAANGFPQYGVEAVVSNDHGQTWDMEHRYILAQWTGNIRGEDSWYGGVQSSSTIQLPDGTLLTTFAGGFRNMPGISRCVMDLMLVKWRMD